MRFTVNLSGGVALDNVDERHGRLQLERKVNGRGQYGFGERRAVQRNDEALEHGLVLFPAEYLV